jgi:hypothetical protein
MNDIEVGDIVDVDADEIAYQGVRVLELVPDVRQASGVLGDDEPHDRSFRGPGFLGKTEEGDLLFSLRQVVSGSKDKYYFGDSELYNFNEAKYQHPNTDKIGDSIDIKLLNGEKTWAWLGQPRINNERTSRIWEVDVKGSWTSYAKRINGKWREVSQDALYEASDRHPYDCTCAMCHHNNAEVCGSCGASIGHGCPDSEPCDNPACVAEREEDYLAEVIRKCGDKWCLFTKHKKDGKHRRLGTHSSRAGAESQEKAIKAHGG